ncbi:MAG: alpha/beta hydrolase [Prevotellaceae bacterium]|jgi:acetyl esterase/lipase|nr:alpha/beta hydrolase [Prevotellaceae bacterium]
MKRRFLQAILVPAFPLLTFSQPIEVAIRPEGTNGITSPEEVEANGRTGNVSQPAMYVYLPQGAAAAPVAAVVICPGGGYTRLAMSHEGHDFAKWLNTNGMAGIVLKYRMPNGHSEAPLSDVRQALRLVRQRAGEWNIAPDKVGVAGFSAGGHLASTVATHLADSATRPDFALLFYPVISMDKSVSHQGSRRQLIGENPAPEQERAYSNELWVTPQTPPTILFLSNDDKTVHPRNSTDFYAALKRSDVPAAMYIFPSGGHGWGMRSTFAYHRAWTVLLKNWLREASFLPKE